MAGKTRVLVTRPEPGATETAGCLAALGFLPIKLPLHEIRSLPVDADAIPDGAAAIAVTSANAIRHAPDVVIGRLKHLPCYTVGEATAVAAAYAGFSTVIEGGGDAQSLAEAITARRPAGPLAYLCGRVRRQIFEKRLADEGIAIHALETYDTIGLSYSTEEIINLTARRSIDYVLVYSANAAEVLIATIRRPELEELFEDTIFACISGRVVEALGGQLRGRIQVAPEPAETALLSLLRHKPDEAS